MWAAGVASGYVVSSGSPTKRGRMEDDNDAIAQRLAAMERDVLKREAAAEQKRLALLKEVEQEEKEARMARIQFEHARRESLGDNHVRSSPPPTGPCVRLVATQMTTHIDPASAAASRMSAAPAPLSVPCSGL